MALSEKYRRWQPMHWGGGLSGWGYLFGISWDAASMLLFTPWFGVGFYYESLHPMYQPPAVVNGVWMGWGRNPITEGGLRYKHDTGRMATRYCEELA